MKKFLKVVVIIIVTIIFLAMAMFEPEEPKGDLVPYMSDQPIKAKELAYGKPVTSEEKRIEFEDLGEYTLTAYCPCSICCGKTNGITATGTKATANHTIAVDPRKIPYGTELVINGEKYVAEDCGGAIKGNHIDIFFNTHSEALAFGKQKSHVYIFNELSKED